MHAKSEERVPLMSAISIWKQSAQICFIVSEIHEVAYDMVSFGAEFQSDSANDGRVSEG